MAIGFSFLSFAQAIQQFFEQKIEPECIFFTKTYPVNKNIEVKAWNVEKIRVEMFRFIDRSEW